MKPDVNELLDRIAHAGWPQGEQEWAVLRVMLMIEQWAMRASLKAKDEIILSLANRVFAQAELLARRAEKVQ